MPAAHAAVSDRTPSWGRVARLSIRLFALIVALVALLALGYLSLVPTHVPPAPPPTYDVAAVKARLLEECRSPTVVDADLCQQVKIPKIIGTAGTLRVPTNLVGPTTATGGPGPDLVNRLLTICQQLAEARLGGYSIVIVTGEKHGNRGCEVQPERIGSRSDGGVAVAT